MHAATALAKPATGLVAVSRSCVTKLKDPQSKLSLNTAATQVTEALKKMLEALSGMAFPQSVTSLVLFTLAVMRANSCQGVGWPYGSR